MAGILITPRSLSRGGHPALAPLVVAGFELVMPCPGETPREDDLVAALANCVGWLAGVEPVSPRVIDAGPRLRVISRNGTGIDNLPMERIAARGIRVLKAEGTNARGVAELALAFALAGLRNLVLTHEGMRQGGWPRVLGREICESTVGVIGLGAIGATFAELCLGLGARVTGFDPLAGADRVRHARFQRADRDSVLETSDVLSLHCPMPMDGRPLLDAGALAAMKRGAVIVNTARAGLVDEAALLDALDTGHIAAYATDVFAVEPPAPSALLAHHRVTLTSHIGGFTDASVERSTVRAVQNLLAGLHAD